MTPLPGKTPLTEKVARALYDRQARWPTCRSWGSWDDLCEHDPATAERYRVMAREAINIVEVGS